MGSRKHHFHSDDFISSNILNHKMMSLLMYSWKLQVQSMSEVKVCRRPECCEAGLGWILTTDTGSGALVTVHGTLLHCHDHPTMILIITCFLLGINFNYCFGGQLFLSGWKGENIFLRNDPNETRWRSDYIGKVSRSVELTQLIDCFKIFFIRMILL